MEITEVSPVREWHALDDDVVVGRAYVRGRPDRRTYVAVDAWDADVGAELLEAAGFRAWTVDAPRFDPATYPVALDATGALAGLARAWGRTEGVPRLGLIAVRRPHRRRGLATALLHRAFAPLAARGVTEVSAEVDAADTASRTLLDRFGTTRTGGTVEVRREA
jgi:GNAT superfamily N-acetyltransferase